MTFHLRMAWSSLWRSRGLTAVMIAALSAGIATWYVQHQVFAFLDGKMPEAPERLYLVQMERGQPEAIDDANQQLPSLLLAPAEVDRVAAAAPGRFAITFGAPALVEPADRVAETVRVRYATHDLFALFDIPFVEGGPWATTGEAVIAEPLARRLFDGPAVGRTLRVDGAELLVTGVVAARHEDRYHLYERFVTVVDEVYLPFGGAAAARAVPDLAHAGGYATAWVELPEAARAGFERATGTRLRSAASWRGAFAAAGTIMLWPLLAWLCLATSIVNLVRMLMAKFAGRGHDLGLLRALGARRRAVMGQLLLEATLIGALACAAGLALGVAMMPLAVHTLAQTPGAPAILDGRAVVATLAASIAAALAAALYPAWRLARGAPAAQLRSR